MEHADLAELELEDDGGRLRVVRSLAPDPTVSMPVAMPMGGATPAPFGSESAASASPSPEASVDVPEDDPSTVIVKSPMVGTFYRKPSPESPAYVEVGTKIDPESVVCIVEAMKVMNEIHAETKGVVAEILVEDGDSVEYGQGLFKVKTA